MAPTLNSKAAALFSWPTVVPFVLAHSQFFSLPNPLILRNRHIEA
jgi:hypothetical protein